MMITSKVLSAIRNAGLAKKTFGVVPMSKMSLSILEVLYSEGIINGYSTLESGRFIRVYMSYFESDIPIACSLKGISRPGFRKFISYRNVVKYYSGKFLILNTSRGVITGTEALKFQIGGELIAMRYYFLFNIGLFLTKFYKICKKKYIFWAIL